MKTILVATAALTLVLAACDSPAPDDESGGSRPGLAWDECPDQISISVTSRHRCGTLTVSLDATEPDGPTLALDVIQTWPSDESGTDDVAVSVGFNFGEPAHDAGSMAALAERLGVSVVALAPRGVREAGGPGLGCPEADHLSQTLAGRSDAAGRAAFVDAVDACRDRLADEGVDPASFGVDDLAADLEALRTGLDADRWYAMVSYGELSRLSDAYATTYDDRTRTIVKDSPLLPEADPFAVGGSATRSALAALFEECDASRRCAQRYPDLEGAWRQALERAASRPLSGDGSEGVVLVDDAKLLRAVRAMLGGDGPVHVADLPRVIVTAAAGRLHPRLAAVVASDPGFCNGYRPLCTNPGFTLGAYLSQVCPGVESAGAAEDEEAYRQVFAQHPYLEACAVWGVPAAPAPTAADVPTLVLTGHLDGWSRAEWFDDAVAVRGATHDVSGYAPCAREIRRRWITDPSNPPEPSPCDTAPLPAWD